MFVFNLLPLSRICPFGHLLLNAAMYRRLLSYIYFFILLCVSIRVMYIRVMSIRVMSIRVMSIRVMSIRVMSIRVMSIRVMSIRVMRRKNGQIQSSLTELNRDLRK